MSELRGEGDRVARCPICGSETAQRASWCAGCGSAIGTEHASCTTERHCPARKVRVAADVRLCPNRWSTTNDASTGTSSAPSDPGPSRPPSPSDPQNEFGLTGRGAHASARLLGAKSSYRSHWVCAVAAALVLSVGAVFAQPSGASSATGGPPSVFGAQLTAVAYVGNVENAGANAPIRYGQGGYILFATMPWPSARSFAFSDGGNLIRDLPSYVSAIRGVHGDYTYSDNEFSRINNPAASGGAVYTGLLCKHAPGPGISVPLLDIELGAGTPPLFYLGIISNTHAGNPDDYPDAISISVGGASAVAQTNHGNGAPSGDIDVFFFRIEGAQPGERVIVSASQSIVNPYGGNFNPSMAGVLFAASNPLTSGQPEAEQTSIPMNGSGTGATGGRIQVLSGQGDFSSVSPANKTVTASPGQALNGVITLRVNNLGPPSDVAPLIYTPSWGDPSGAWRPISNSVPTGQSTQTAQISVAAPTAPGVYHLLFAFQWEIGGDHVASATNWALGTDTWHDGNDIAALSSAQVAEAQAKGYTMDNWLTANGYKPEYVPADAVTVIVKRNVSSIGRIDQRAVWANPPDDLYKCSDAPACVELAMRRSGAAPQAIAFAKTLGFDGYLYKFVQAGRVDMGTVMFPFRANDNFEPYLLNGNPRIIDVRSEVTKVDLRRLPTFGALSELFAAHVRATDPNARGASPAYYQQDPNSLLSDVPPSFVEYRTLTSGKTEFVYALEISTCHACDELAQVHVGLVFDAQGNYLGPRLGRVTQGKN